MVLIDKARAVRHRQYLKLERAVTNKCQLIYFRKQCVSRCHLSDDCLFPNQQAIVLSHLSNCATLLNHSGGATKGGVYLFIFRQCL